MSPQRILISALGGEGGGVLATWIVNAALAAGHWAQRTSIPGVAQRTGATTYYIEISEKDGAARPILALQPAPGQVDLFIGSELLETTRAVQGGFITPARTFVIAATTRVFTIGEKIAMADGRADPERLEGIVRRFAQRAVLADMGAAAREAGCPINAVMLGAVAESGLLPVTADAFRAAIRAEGKAVEANLRGFEAGGALVRAALAPVGEPATAAAPLSELAPPPAMPDWRGPVPLPEGLPAAALPAFEEGLRRTQDYQDLAYARTYRDRIAAFVGRPGADETFLTELARLLALRMCVEDTIRVAQLKLAESRLARVRAEAKARPGDIIHVTEYLKPGPEEILGVLPEKLGRFLLGTVERLGWSRAAFPMKVRTTGLWGMTRLAGLQALRRFRPISLRQAQETAWVERWLALVGRVLAVDPAAATELVRAAGLVKGYGETYQRGWTSFERIAREIVEPMLDGRIPRAHFADAVLQARIAANADPEGKRLSALVESLQGLGAGPVAAAAE